MSSVEPARHSLYSRLEEVLGPEHAETLMTYLPRYQADEFATKTDIARLESRLDGFEQRFERLEGRFDRLEQRFDQRFERLEGRFDGFEVRLDQMQRTYVVTTVGSLTALTAIFSLMVAFIG